MPDSVSPFLFLLGGGIGIFEGWPQLRLGFIWAVSLNKDWLSLIVEKWWLG